METEINPCSKCKGFGWVECPHCNASTLFGRLGHCKVCLDSGVNECPECKNPEGFK